MTPDTPAPATEGMFTDDDLMNDDENGVCDECGGEGFIEYNDAGPSYWGEDSPSEINHLLICRSCNGSGRVP